MAWNGSDQVKKSTVRRRSHSTGNAAVFKGIVALLIVVAGALAALFFFFLRSNRPSGAANVDAPKTGLIAEVAPDIATKTNAAEIVAEPKAEKPKGPYIGMKVRNSFGEEYTVKHIVKAGTRIENGVVIEDKPLFRHDCLNEIDVLYRNTPGFRIYSGFDAAAFDREYKDYISGVDPESVEVLPTDSEEIAARKRMVQEGLEVIKEAVLRGENPSDLVREARKEIAKMADFRDDCVAVINQMRNDGASGEELEAYYENVNRQLEARNIPPLLSPNNIRERLQLYKMTHGGKKK